MSADLFLRPGASSEDLVDDAPSIVEEAPTITVEPVTERVATQVKYLRDKSTCPECGREIAAYRMSTHMKYKHPADGSAPKTRPTTVKERKPSVPKEPTGRRVKADDILSLAVSGIGSLLGMSGYSPPTGMALKLEAGLLGSELDSAAAGTIVDKALLQPLVKTKGRFDKVGPLVLFPVLVFAIDKNPNLAFPGSPAYGMLRMSMGQILPQLVVAMKRQAAEAEKMQQAARELSEMDPMFAEVFGSAEDPIDALINAIFSTRVVEEPEPTPEATGAWPDE